MKNIEDIELIRLAEGSLNNKTSKEFIEKDKDLMKKVKTFKNTLDALKKFGSLLENRDTRSENEKLSAKIVKLSFSNLRNLKKTS